MLSSLEKIVLVAIPLVALNAAGVDVCATHLAPYSTGQSQRRSDSLFHWKSNWLTTLPTESKYRRIARCWGILENHWNGARLTSIGAALSWARMMTWRGVRPMVSLLDAVYERGTRLTNSRFRPFVQRPQRSETIPKGSIVLSPQLPVFLFTPVALPPLFSMIGVQPDEMWYNQHLP